MTDTISRQAVVEMLDITKQIARQNIDGAVLMTFETVLDSLVNITNALPTHQPEPHWIPVTEEPKESGKYLVTAIISFVPDHVDDPNTYEAVTVANYLADARGSIKWWGNNVEKVLAWMPLPESYKGVTE